MSRDSNMTPREGPNILISFLNADISRYPALGEVSTRQNPKASLWVTKTLNFAQLIVNLTSVIGRPRKGSRSFF